MNRIELLFSDASWPILAALVLGFLTIVSAIYVLIYQRFARFRTNRMRRWDMISEEVIMEAIFFEDKINKDPREDALAILERPVLTVPKKVLKLLQTKNFRSRMLDRIVSAKRNVSGAASENLSRLFNQVNFDFDILNLLSTSIWYKQATALELIGLMKLKKLEHLVVQYLNNEGGLVRMEAQNSVLRFSGFEGLKFLTQSKFPLSEWQQIKMLDELSNLPNEDFKGIEEWLTSKNDSVVIFALKLVRIYHRFELFQEVLSCLTHANPKVRYQAISVIKALPNPDAVPILLKTYPTENWANKIQILKALQEIASETEIDFLTDLLLDPNVEIRLEVARALYKLGNPGRTILKEYQDKDSYPLSQLIAQVKEENQ